MIRILMCFFSVVAMGQQILTEEAFINQFLRNHPEYRSIDLENNRAEWIELQGDAYFEPEFNMELKEKFYKKTEYYDQRRAEFSLPTRFGLDVVGSFELNDGVFLNNSNKVPSQGLPGLGLRWNVTEGLFGDVRNLQRQQFELEADNAFLNAQIRQNDFFLKGLLTFWQWKLIHAKIKVYNQAIEFVNERLDNVRETYIQGDYAAVDTLMVYNQKLEWQILRRKQIAKERQYKAKINYYLNQEQAYRPDSLRLNGAWEYQAVLRNDHPMLIRAQNQADQANLYEQVTKAKRFPKLELGYNALRGEQDNGFLNDWNFNNYNWSVKLNFPIFLRNERANYELARIKSQESQLKLETTQMKLNAELEGWNALLEENALILEEERRQTQTERQLLEAQTTLFENGDVSVFLVNYQETAYIKQYIAYLDHYYLCKENELALLASNNLLANN